MNNMKKAGLFRLNESLRLIVITFVCFASFSFFSGRQEEERQMLEPRITYRMTVPGNMNWTDTGFEVREGQKISFYATGGVSLQVGNPIAFCGPEGYNKKTFQQPIHDKNIGALVGRVVQLISIEIDEETGEETRNEIHEDFFIGKENEVRMPLNGSLYLGINESLASDNAGEFRVEFYLLERDSNKVDSSFQDN